MNLVPPWRFGALSNMFRKALERYTARARHPHGCLGVQGALATGDSGRAVRDLLAAWRNNGCFRVRDASSAPSTTATCLGRPIRR